MSKNQQINYATKPIELPLSTEKEYVLVDVEGFKESAPSAMKTINIFNLTCPFKFDSIECEDGLIGRWYVVQNSWGQERYFREVIRQPQTNEFNTDLIAVTEQEEEEFNAMANNSEIPNSSEWRNGDECVYNGDLWQFVSLLSSEFHGTAVIFDRISEELKQVDFSRLKKPETPEQIAERERMEAAYDLYTHVQSVRGQLSCKFDWFSNSEMEETRLRFLAIVDKTGYRLTK